MTIQVFSEIGRLRRVLLHRPGYEIDWMVPSMMERLLFDDILYGEEAREEHATFERLLASAGVEVLDPQRLLAEVLADTEARRDLFARLEKEDGVAREALAELAELEPAELARCLVTGIRTEPQRPGEKLRNFYRLPPLPNYFFQRDPQVVVGRHVVVSAMATEARAREPLLSRTVFARHPALAGHAGLIELGHPSYPEHARPPSLEGGDVLVPTPEILLVGLSERTNRRGIQALAEHLRTSAAGFRHLVVVELPAQRSYMHLDTVFTFIDHGLCLAYLPVIMPHGAEAGDVFHVDLTASRVAYTLGDSLPKVLEELGMEVELVPCGGADSIIEQKREQWTDGANAFALAPGVIALYRRNRATAEELARRGWRVIAEEDVIAGREELLERGPTVVTLACNELARARGGPRCMTMPLARDPLA